MKPFSTKCFLFKSKLDFHGLGLQGFQAIAPTDLRLELDIKGYRAASSRH